MTPKQINIAYWVLTVLAAAMMGLSSYSNILSSPEAVDLVVTKMGYPAYFLPLIGVCKLLGSITILIPGFARIKDWAYAGLMFDITAAMYSFVSIGEPINTWSLLFLPVFLLGGSYFFYIRKLHAAQVATGK
jgi:uncharacterized membrane protein YphA (DoxX/SURF4 family)